MKYTPGPWEIHGANYHNEILIGQEGRKHSSGKVVHVGWDICGYESEEWKANAKLIASAPEMLEALESAVKFIRNCPELNDDERKPKGLEHWESIIKKATL